MPKFKFLLVLGFIVAWTPFSWSAETVQVLIDEPTFFDQQIGWVWVTEQDQQPLRFVLDTGAGANVMAKTSARKLDLSCKNSAGYLYTGDGSQSPGMLSDLGRIPLIVNGQKHRVPFWCFDAPDFFTDAGIDGVVSIHQLFEAGDYMVLDPLNQRLMALKGSPEAVRSYLQTYAGTNNQVQTLIRQKMDDELYDNTIFVETDGQIFGFDTGAEITEISKDIRYDQEGSEISEAEITDAQGHTIKMDVIQGYNLVFCGNQHTIDVMVHRNSKHSLGLTEDDEKVVAVLGRDVLNNYLLAFPQNKSEPILGICVTD